MLFILSLLAAGVCLCIVIYVLLSPRLDNVDSQDKQAFSSTGLRMLLPWVNSLSTLVSPFLTWKYQLKLKQEILEAGLTGQLNPRHIAGFQSLSAILACLVALYLFKWMLGMTWLSSTLMMLVFVGIGLHWPLTVLRNKARVRKRSILKAFPFVLDMTTLCVESGMNLHGALIQTAQTIPDNPLRQELQFALSEMRTGLARADALREMANRIALVEIKQWVASINQTESLGMGLGPMLRAQADQRRSERFLRAEKLALEAPVKMLLPLVVCIFPCTFIVLAFPIGMKLLNSGL